MTIRTGETVFRFIVKAVRAAVEGPEEVVVAAAQGAVAANASYCTKLDQMGAMASMESQAPRVSPVRQATMVPRNFLKSTANSTGSSVTSLK